MNYLMSNERRREVRWVARTAYLKTAERFITPHLNQPEILRITLGETRQKLIESKRFKSVLGGVFLALAMKFAVKMIEQWIEDNLFTEASLPRDYAKGEPGYAEK